MSCSIYRLNKTLECLHLDKFRSCSPFYSGAWYSRSPCSFTRKRLFFSLQWVFECTCYIYPFACAIMCRTGCTVQYWGITLIIQLNCGNIIYHNSESLLIYKRMFSDWNMGVSVSYRCLSKFLSFRKLAAIRAIYKHVFCLCIIFSCVLVGFTDPAV